MLQMGRWGRGTSQGLTGSLAWWDLELESPGGALAHPAPVTAPLAEEPVGQGFLPPLILGTGSGVHLLLLP